MNRPSTHLKLAERGPIVSICVYLVLAVTKLVIGNQLSSDSLRADAFNNLSDIVGNVAILIGLRMAQKPADSDHKFGHWKMEDLASLVTSLIMFAVGFDLLFETGQNIINQTAPQIDILGAWVGLISALIMLAVYRYNRSLAKKVHSKGLATAAKDNLADAITSIGTSIAIVASSLRFPLVDKIVAILITFFILKTAYDIFMESFFTLSDGFDDQLLLTYQADILKIPKIHAVKSQRGRMYGSNIYLDIVLEMHPDLSVQESHAITEQVEKLLHIKYQVLDVDIHVEPAPVDQVLEGQHLFNQLFRYEAMIQGKMEDYTQLLSDHVTWLTEEGQHYGKAELVANLPATTQLFQDFQVVTISPQTKRVHYQTENTYHTSIWHHHESWQLVYHQVQSL